MVWDATLCFVGAIANTYGQRNSQTMKKLLASLIVLVLATSAFAQTPTATPTAAYDFPNAPTMDQSVTGPAGQTLTWDGSKWVAVGAMTGMGGTFAPLVNPPNGVNNYAPINAPSFTGLTIASQMQVANTLSAPTATFGNATISTGGNLMLAGTAALYFNGIPMGGTCAAGNAVTVINNRGVPTCSPFGPAGGPWLPVNNPTFTGTLTGPNQVNTGGIDSLTWNYGQGLQASVGLGYGNTTESSFLIGQGMSYNGNYPNSWTRGGNASYGPTAVGSIQMAGAATVITGDTNLSAGQAFTPTMLFSISPVAYPLIPAMGNQSIDAAATFHLPVILPNTQNSMLLFGSATAPTAAFAGNGAADALNITAGAHLVGGAWIADATSAQDIGLTSSGIDLYTATGLTVGSPANWTHLANFTGLSQQLSGLQLGGFSTFNPTPIPTLHIGQVYFGSMNWSQLYISGNAYSLADGSGFITDGGAGAGVSYMELNYGGGGFWNAGPLPQGANVPYSEIMTWGTYGIKVTHIENDQDYGVPSCTNCTAIAAGARDTDGFLQISGSWPITLHFAKPFTGSAVCTGNTLASPPNQGVVSFYQNTTTSIQIYCNLSGGAACSMQTGWISYHCFGYGA